MFYLFFKIFIVCVCLLNIVAKPSLINASTIEVDKNDISCINSSGQPNPSSIVYCKIQDAITDASDNDSINVATGTYTESLTVAKPLSLVGSDTILEGVSSSIKICSGTGTLSSLSIDGFTIQDNSDNGIVANAGLCGDQLEIDNLQISNCTLDNNRWTGLGILNGSIVNTLSINNTSFSNHDTAVAFSSDTVVSNVTISDSTFNENNYGFYVLWADNIDSVLIDNTVFTNHSNNGIHVNGAPISDLTIQNSTLENNVWNAIFRDATLTDTTISNNDFGHSSAGSSLSFASGTFSNLLIENNNFYDGAWEYMDLGVGWIGTANFSNTIVRNNSFLHPDLVGVLIWIDSTSNFSEEDITLEKNTFLADSTISNKTSTQVLAINNWWGSTTGPTEVSNPEGEGTTIDDNVFTYNPWCQHPFTPGTPTTSATHLNQKPTWTWTAAVTCALSLNSTPYSVQWCQNSDFSNCSSNTQLITTNSFTHATSLSDGTWYFRVKARDILDNYSSYSNYGSIVIDTQGPSLSNITATPLNESATISWTTSESASSKIEYDLNTSYQHNSGTLDTSPRVTEHSVELTGLKSCTNYNYKIISTDSYNHQTTSANKSFTTLGCPGDAGVRSQTKEDIAISNGGSVEIKDVNTDITLTIPSNYTNSETITSASFQIKKLEKEPIKNNFSNPNEYEIVADYIFNITALSNISSLITDFDNNLTINLKYSDENIINLNQNDLSLMHWKNDAWEFISGCTHDKTTKTISCPTNSLSMFALFAKKSNTAKPPSCDEPSPEKAPILYAAVAESSTSTSIYFYYPTGTSDETRITHYSVRYTDDLNDKNKYYADNLGNKNIQKFTINSLNPETKYYFEVKANIDCGIGPYSETISVTTPASSNDLLSNKFTHQIKDLETVNKNESNTVTQANNETQTNETVDNTQTTELFDLSITLVDEQNVPLEGAKLEVHSEPQIAYTNKLGVATFKNIEKGKHKLFISYNDYETEHELNLSDPAIKEYKITIEIVKKDNQLLNYSLISMLTLSALILAYLLIKKKLKQTSKIFYLLKKLK